MPTYSGNGSYTYDIPSSAAAIRIKARGGAGGNNGGNAGYVDAKFDASNISASTLDITVGGNGGIGSGGANGGGDPGGNSGGGGGGKTTVRPSGGGLNSSLVVAGGGGGRGGTSENGDQAGGGSAGGPSGASGGDDTGSAGASAQGGGGGTQSSGGGGGGASGGYFSESGNSGGHGTGGRGAGTYSQYGGSAHAGGGGAGWYGGGGGGAADDNAAAGGGGGSNYIDSAGYDTTSNNSWQSEEVVITALEKPASPNNVAQTLTGDTSSDISWDADTSAGTNDHYEVQKSVDGGSWTTVASNVTQTSYTATLSASPDTFRFRVRSVNSMGSSAWTASGTKSTNITSVTRSNTTDTSFDVAWEAADGIQDYDVLLAEASGSTEVDYAVNQTVAAGTTTASVTGLENGERYYVRVVARYSGADSLSTVEDATTTTLPAPTLDSLDVSTEGEITVNYSLPDNSSDGDVLVEVSTDSGQTWTNAGTVSDLSQTSFVDTGLLDGEQYTYRVTRRTDHAEKQSGTLTAQTILPAPTNLSVQTTTSTSGTATWTANHDNGETRVEYRRTDSGDAWTTDTTVTYDVETEDLTGLLNGEQYDVRVVAQTEHDETEDQ